MNKLIQKQLKKTLHIALSLITGLLPWTGSAQAKGANNPNPEPNRRTSSTRRASTMISTFQRRKKQVSAAANNQISKDQTQSIKKTSIQIRQEIISKRTEYSKTFFVGKDKEGRNTYELEAGITPKHYQDSHGNYQELNMHLSKEGYVDQSVYEASILKDNIGYQIKHKEDQGGFRINIQKIGEHTLNYTKPKIDKNIATWEEIVPNVDLSIIFYPHRVRIWRTLKNNQAPNDITVEVIEDLTKEPKNLILQDRIVGFDHNQKPTHSERKTLKELITKTSKTTLNHDLFTQNIIKIDESTRRKELIPHFVYPVRIDGDVDVKITAGANDGRAARTTGGYFSSVNTNNASMTIQSGAFNTVGFYLFNGITIPQSTVVNTASLKVYLTGVNFAPLTFRFQGKKLATPVVPTAVAQVITPGTLATASASFAGITPGTGAYQTYSIKAIVQELVNAFDYANDKMLFFHNSLSGRVFVRAYDFNAAQSANLVINFVGGDSTDPTISTLSPADGETGVGIASNLVLTFDEAVDVESGNITIYDAADDSATATIAVTDGQVTGTGTTAITVNPTSDLIGGTSYYVQVAATGFDDAA
ncbi:MAG: hypothetical protein ACI9Y8_001358, partial [Candidatus Omnitrophota bacterium]